MDDVLGGQNVAAGHQIVEDGAVGLEDVQPLVLAGELIQLALGVDGDLHGDVGGDLGIALADIEGVQTEGRRGVDAAGAGIQRDVIAQNDQRIPVHEGGW